MVHSFQDQTAPGFLTGLVKARTAVFAVAVMSAMINILYLTGSFYMLEVYDRVLPSRSVATLIGLSAIVAGLFAFQGVLDILRLRIMARIGVMFDRALHRPVHALVLRAPLTGSAASDGLQPLRDMDQIRSFVGSAGPIALFDLPWMPFYLAICFAFHVYIGLVTLAGAALLISITILADLLMRRPSRFLAAHNGLRTSEAEAARRNAEVVQAMGMAGRLTDRWSKADASYQASQLRAADISGGLGAFSKIVRTMLQSGVLGLGAYLVINQQATAGVIIASSILTSRALSPVELALSHWKSFVAARQSWKRLSSQLRSSKTSGRQLALPTPMRDLVAEGLGVAPPGVPRMVVQDATFTLQAGNALGIVGPSGSGKSSLVRALIGIWPTLRGKVRLDGAAIEQWSPEVLGHHVGYLPQEVELFAGTIAENISRFAVDIDSETVIKAARAADVHDLILRLPDGYDTRLDEGGTSLSMGQRQRIALARALYGEPFLVVLDEPNSNLDAEGETALTSAIMGLRQRGAVVVVVAHRPSAIAACDHVLMMANGRVQAFGPKDEVLSKILQHPSSRPPPAAASHNGLPGMLKVVTDAEAVQ